MRSPAEFAEALRGERSKKRRRTWLLASISAAVVAVLGVGIWLLFFSSTFEARETIVEGNTLLTVDEVLAAAAVPTGAPLATVDTGRIEARVLELPEVKEASVGRDFPDAVRIALEERTAAYQLERAGSLSWVDEDGIIFRTNQAAVEEIPVARVTGEADDRILKDIATVVRHIPDAVTGAVARIDARSVDRIEISLDGGRTVVWGSADESDLKSQVLAPLLSVEAKVYDVSAPNHPTTR